MNYDFDTIIARRGTDCEKWDLPAEDGVLPLWVADMDFRAAPAIVDALCRRVEEGVFGYALPSGSWHESLVRWLNVRHRWQVPSDTVLDATGVIPALAAVIRAFCEPGDKVVVQTPVYNCFFTTAMCLKILSAVYLFAKTTRVISPTKWTLKTWNAKSPIRA